MIKLMLNYINSLKVYSNYSFPQDIKDYIEEYKGLTGAGTIDVLRNCIKFIDRDKCYLEVGIYQGTNFAAVAKKAPCKCYGVDNFSEEFQENKLFEKTTEQLVQDKIEKFELKNCEYFKQDYRDFLSERKDLNGQKVEIYFYDGPHSYLDQLDGILLARELLADQALVFIDDYASPNVQKSVEVLTKEHGFKLIKLLNYVSDSREYFGQGQCILLYERNK